MNTEALPRILFVCIIAIGFIAGCGEEEQSYSPQQPTTASEPPKFQVESPAQEYGKYYTKLLEQKQAKEGLVVNIVAETKKKVAAFRQASPEERAKLLEDLKKQVEEYNAAQ